MHTIADATVDAHSGDVDGLYAQTPAVRARRCAVGNFALPTDVLHVGLVPYSWVARRDAVICGAAGTVGRSRLALAYEYDFNGLYAQSLAGRAGKLPVLLPCLPANVLNMPAVVDVVGVRDVSGKPELDGLNTQSFAGRTRHRAASHLILPADVLHVRLAADVAAGVLKAEIIALYAQSPAGRAPELSVLDPVLPANVLHVSTILNGRGGSLCLYGIRRLTGAGA